VGSDCDEVGVAGAPKGAKIVVRMESAIEGEEWVLMLKFLEGRWLMRWVAVARASA
jgi:hypothetical protein